MIAHSSKGHSGVCTAVVLIRYNNCSLRLLIRRVRSDTYVNVDSSYEQPPLQYQVCGDDIVVLAKEKSFTNLSLWGRKNKTKTQWEA